MTFVRPNVLLRCDLKKTKIAPVRPEVNLCGQRDVKVQELTKRPVADESDLRLNRACK